MNWRIITGLALLILGIRVFYTAYLVTNNANVTANASYAKVGSIVWICVGVFLVMKGMAKKEA